MIKNDAIKDLAKRFDHSNMAKVIERTPNQIEIALNESMPKAPEGPFSQVVIAGMGGSALPVDIIADAFAEKLKVPLRVSRNYYLPSTVNNRTLVVVSSFSGGTEEALSVIDHFTKESHNVAVISAGGKLSSIAQERGYPLVQIHKEVESQGFQPRSATGYFVTLFTRLFFDAGIVNNPLTELKAVPKFLRSTEIRDDAEDTARWFEDKIPIIYTDESHLMSIARVAKIKLNENSKRPAFFNAFPEANHNEMIGFGKPLAKFGILYLHDPSSHPKILSRYNVMKAVFEKEKFENVSFRMWEIPGTTKIQKIFAAIMYADWCSYSLALLDGLDPTPVALVESFKHDIEANPNQ